MIFFRPRYLTNLFFLLVFLFPRTYLWATPVNRIDIVPPSMKIINERYHYSPAVRAGDTLYIAGQVGRDADMKVVIGKEAQLVQAFENLKTVLEAASAGFDDVVEIVTYHTDMRDLALVVEVKDRYFKDRYPTWTGVGVTSLSTPGLEFEIKATAYLGE
jgi:enamine deaminase RidA (YjgF/YER057c/UK114 family)